MPAAARTQLWRAFPYSGGQHRSRFLLSLSEEFYRQGLFFDPPALSLPSAANKAREQIGGVDLGPSIPFGGC